MSDEQQAIWLQYIRVHVDWFYSIYGKEIAWKKSYMDREPSLSLHFEHKFFVERELICLRMMFDDFEKGEPLPEKFKWPRAYIFASCLLIFYCVHQNHVNLPFIEKEIRSAIMNKHQGLRPTFAAMVSWYLLWHNGWSTEYTDLRREQGVYDLDAVRNGYSIGIEVKSIDIDSGRSTLFRDLSIIFSTFKKLHIAVSDTSIFIRVKTWSGLSKRGNMIDRRDWNIIAKAIRSGENSVANKNGTMFDIHYDQNDSLRYILDLDRTGMQEAMDRIYNNKDIARKSYFQMFTNDNNVKILLSVDPDPPKDRFEPIRDELSKASRQLAKIGKPGVICVFLSDLIRKGDDARGSFLSPKSYLNTGMKKFLDEGRSHILGVYFFLAHENEGKCEIPMPGPIHKNYLKFSFLNEKSEYRNLESQSVFCTLFS